MREFFAKKIAEIRAAFAAKMKEIRVKRLKKRFGRLYRLYHQSFLDNILEAQETHMLPRATIDARNKINAVVDQLKVLDPQGNWVNFN